MEKTLDKAIKGGRLPKLPLLEVLDLAVERQVIDQYAAERLRVAEKLRREVITVDEFSKDYLRRQ